MEDRGAGLCHYERRLELAGADAETDSLAGGWLPTLRPELESILFPLV